MVLTGRMTVESGAERFADEGASFKGERGGERASTGSMKTL